MDFRSRSKTAIAKAQRTPRTAKKKISAALCILCAIAFAVLSTSVFFVYANLFGVEYLGREGIVFQRGPADCGAASLLMVLLRHGLPVSYPSLLSELNPSPAGLSMLDLKNSAERHGLVCSAWQLHSRELAAIPLPALLYLRRGHFVVLDSRTVAGEFILLDPARGKLKLTARRLNSIWGGEALLFHQSGEAAGRGSRWFAASHIQKE